MESIFFFFFFFLTRDSPAAETHDILRELLLATLTGFVDLSDVPTNVRITEPVGCEKKKTA
jgi:hypothetical protein